MVGRYPSENIATIRKLLRDAIGKAAVKPRKATPAECRVLSAMAMARMKGMTSGKWVAARETGPDLNMQADSYRRMLDPEPTSAEVGTAKVATC